MNDNPTFYRGARIKPASHAEERRQARTVQTLAMFVLTATEAAIEDYKLQRANKDYYLLLVEAAWDAYFKESAPP